jgi:HlyD family secretion protein
LFRERGEWHVFQVADGRAILQKVETGKSNGLETEILSGLAEGTVLILHPTDKIENGVRVQTD